MGHAHIERQAPPTHPQANTHELMHDAAKNAALSHLNAPRILRVSCSGFPFFFLVTPFSSSSCGCYVISLWHLFSFAAIFGAVLHIFAIICIIDDCDAAAASDS